MFSKISDVLQDGKKVNLHGWVYRQRTSKNVNFIILRDSSGIIQCAFKNDNLDFEKAGKVYVESSVEISGIVKKDERAPGGWEVQAEKLIIISSLEPFPIAKDLSPEFLMDVRHLWIRSQKITNIMKARSFAIKYFREFFEKEGFWEIATPILTQAGVEGGSTLFELDYFGQKAYLAQSAQLYLEALVASLEKVFVLGPSFRAEKSRTVKHLTEYWHLEPEMAWFSHEDNMKFQEEMVSYVCQKMSQHTELLKFFDVDPQTLKAVKPPFERIEYDDAIKLVKKKWGDDFGTEDEKILTDGKKKPVFIVRWPKEAKPFYMRIDPNDSKKVLNDDLLAPNGHGEIIGGSERSWEYKELVQNIRDKGLNIKAYEWYIDLRKYGAVPHSGFGLGIERFLKWILNLEHIRDAIPFPRVINRVYP